MAKKITLLDDLYILAMPWYQMCKNTIKHSFKLGRFIKESVIVGEGLDENIQPLDMREQHNDSMAINEHITVAAELLDLSLIHI